MVAKVSTVVFGDRDLKWSRALRDRLRKNGYHVLAATSPKALLDLVERHAPDVVVLDDGFEEVDTGILTSLIHSLHAPARLILIRPDGAPADDSRIDGLRPRSVLTRTTALHTLIEEVDRVVRTGTAPAQPALVMCIDDEPAFLHSLSRVLRREGYAVVEYDDSERAREALSLLRPDLVILDVLMPGMNGLDLAEEIREKYGSSLPLLLLTGRTSDRDIAEGYRRGADGYLLKPCTSEALLSAAGALVGSEPGKDRTPMERRNP